MLPWRKHPQGFWSAWSGSLLSFSPVYVSQEFLFPWSGGELPTSRSGSFAAGISPRKSDWLPAFRCRYFNLEILPPAFLTLAVCLSPRYRQPFSLWRFACRLDIASFLSQRFDQLSTPLAFLRRFVITDSFKIMNSQIENNLSYLGTSFSILMAFLFMNSQIDIYDRHIGSE